MIRGADGDEWTDGLEGLRADAADVDQIVHGFERGCASEPDDVGGAFRSDSRQRLKFGCGGPVQVDAAGGVGAGAGLGGGGIACVTARIGVSANEAG